MSRRMLPGIVEASLPEETSMKLVMALADREVDAAEHVLRVVRVLDDETLLRLAGAFRGLDSDPFSAGRFDRLDAGARRLAVPALAGLLREGPASILQNAARALCRLDPERARAALALGEYNAEALDEGEFRALLGG
jgi:hypothetical protein